MTASGGEIEGLRPLDITDVNQAIQERLMRFIQERRLAPGDRLPSEGALAQALGVSRGTLREAMRSMEALGIVGARVGLGWYVQQFTLDPVARALALTLEPDEETIHHLDEIRAGLEVQFLDQAIRTLTQPDIEALEKAVSEMESLAAAGQSCFVQDRAFHRSMFAHIANPLFGKFMELFWSMYVFILPHLEPSSGESHVAAAMHHRAMLDAFAAGDLKLARQRFLADHLEAAGPAEAHSEPSKP